MGVRIRRAHAPPLFLPPPNGGAERVRQQMDAAAQRGGYHYHFYVVGWGCQVMGELQLVTTDLI